MPKVGADNLRVPLPGAARSTSLPSTISNKSSKGRKVSAAGTPRRSSSGGGSPASAAGSSAGGSLFRPAGSSLARRNPPLGRSKSLTAAAHCGGARPSLLSKATNKGRSHSVPALKNGKPHPGGLGAIAAMRALQAHAMTVAGSKGNTSTVSARKPAAVGMPNHGKLQAGKKPLATGASAKTEAKGNVGHHVPPAGHNTTAKNLPSSRLKTGSGRMGSVKTVKARWKKAATVAKAKKGSVQGEANEIRTATLHQQRAAQHRTATTSSAVQSQPLFHVGGATATPSSGLHGRPKIGSSPAAVIAHPAAVRQNSSTKPTPGTTKHTSSVT